MRARVRGTRIGRRRVVAVLVAIHLVFGGITAEYVVEYWATYFKGVPVDVPFLPCAIAGLFFGAITIPAAIATWVISFVL